MSISESVSCIGREAGHSGNRVVNGEEAQGGGDYIKRKVIWAMDVAVSLLEAIIGFSWISASREAQGAAAGSLRWKFKTGDAITSSPAMSADGTIYFGSKDNCVYAISSTGEQVGKFQTGGDVTASPAIGPDGTIYVGSHDQYFYAFYADGSLRQTSAVDMGHEHCS